MRISVFQILKWSPLVAAIIAFYRVLFLLCGVPRRYSTPEVLPDGSVNPLFNMNSLIDNLRVTMLHNEKANNAFVVIVFLLGFHIAMMHIEIWLQKHRKRGCSF